MMFRINALLLALFMAISPVAAQWQTPNHSVPVGRGKGVTGFGNVAPGTAGLPFTSTGATTDPAFQQLPAGGLAPGAAASNVGTLGGVLGGTLPNPTFAPIASGNVLANATAGSAAPVATPATTWFDRAYCSTVGFLIVRTTGAWTCSQGSPANVTWWGADKTGAASSSAAITTMKASGVSHFYFPCGTYLITSSIQPASFQTWEGEAFRCVNINQSGIASTNGLFDLTADTVQEVRITNFSLGTFAAGSGILSRGNFGVYLQNILCASAVNICINIQASATNGYRIYIDTLEIIASAGLINNGVQIGTAGNANIPANVYIANSEIANTVNCGVEIFSGGGVVIDKTEFLTNAGNGLCTFPSAGQSIQALFITNTYFDTNSQNGILLSENGGTVRDVSLANTWMASNVFNGLEILVGSGHVSGVNIVGGRILNNKQHGIFMNGGDHVTIAGLQVEGNSEQGSGLFDGINIFGTQHVQIVAGVSGIGGFFGPGGSANLQRYGINIAGGGADYILVSSMDLCSNVTGSLINSSAATHNVIRDNPCFNPVGVSTISVGASPYTFTNGAIPTTVYMNGGTVTNIAIGAAVVGSGTTALNPLSFELGPNESMTVTYSVIPNMFKAVH